MNRMAASRAKSPFKGSAMKRLTMIAAVARNWTIGKENGLPWRLSSDLKRFRRVTMGKAIILGRNTMESIGKPLLGRHSIVLTQQTDFAMPGVAVARSVNIARELAESLGDPDEAMVIGGETVYRAFFPIADAIHLTVVDTVCEGDARFPVDQFANVPFVVTHVEDHPALVGDDYSYTIYRLERGNAGHPLAWTGQVKPDSTIPFVP
jgi:dihydrofolate reductase